MTNKQKVNIIDVSEVAGMSISFSSVLGFSSIVSSIIITPSSLSISRTVGFINFHNFDDVKSSELKNLVNLS